LNQFQPPTTASPEHPAINEPARFVTAVSTWDNLPMSTNALNYAGFELNLPRT